MKSYITIDGGTTNTRINLVRDGKIEKTIKKSIGARVGIENKEILKSEIKKAVNEITKDQADRIDRILASGMITSEFGLYDLPLILAPAGIEHLHNGMKETVLPEITNIPFAFIPGVKISDGSLENTDIMRGEETEIIGLTENLQSGCMYILPGSHSKLIETDDRGRIISFVTALTGEMIFTLSQNTILKDAVDLSQTEIDEEYLIKGYEYCEEKEINFALFKTRILKNIFLCTDREIYSFFLGVVLRGEIKEIIKSKAQKIVIGGKAQIKNATAILLRSLCGKETVCVCDERVNTAPSLGAIKIYEYTDGR